MTARAPGAPALVVLDIGNTAVKVVVFDAAGAVLSTRRVLSAAVDASLVSLNRAPRSVPVVAVSVHPGHLALVRRAMKPPRLLLLGRDFPLAVVNRTARPRETGHDRLCAALAAHHRARGAAVALGLGTAVTADVVDADGAFLGGAIAPGLRAASAGLAEAAPALPRVEHSRTGPVPFPGRTTREALRAGALLGFAGLVDRLAGEAARAAGSGVPVYLHGGDAVAVLPRVVTPVRFAPSLVAEGCRLLWLRAGGGA